MLEGIFFYSCIWLELQVFAVDNNSQVDGRVVQREAGQQVQRGLLGADGRRSLTGVQVFRIELLCCLLSDRSQTSTPIHLKHCIAPIHPKGQLMGSPSRFQACEPHMLFQCQSNAASSLINWLDFFTKTLKTATTLWLCQVIHNKAEWTKWEDILNTNASLPRDVYAGNMIIPTLDTVRWVEACICKIWTLQYPSYPSQVPTYP